MTGTGARCAAGVSCRLQEVLVLASFFARAALPVLVGLVAVSFPVIAGGQEVPAEATVCHDGSLARQRTEIDADISVPGFDPALGTLLEVQVPTQSVHLDTDAKFENTAQTAVTFAETMTYQVTFTSPGGLPSPAPISGTIPRVPSQMLTAFDGTLDYLGASAVTQPSTARDESASAVSSSDPGVLAAFTGGLVAFHVATNIGEVFNGGGGNVEFQINTFASATVRVCYRYAPPAPPPTSPPSTRPPKVTVASATAPPAPVPAAAHFTG
jgi:hypothetical protein